MNEQVKFPIPEFPSILKTALSGTDWLTYMRNIQLVPARRDQLGTLNNLMQLYLHDFSEFYEEEEMRVSESGLFELEYSLERYFDKPNFWAYLGRVDGNLCGFVLVSNRVRHREEAGRYIDEFFVLRAYRRQGIGCSLALQTFNTYRGYWEVAQISANRAASAFWRKVIGEYTNGRYEEFTATDECGDVDIWQVFDSGRW